MSSLRYPQSNGKVENAVKTAKALLKKSIDAGIDPYLALLDWRNTPSEQLKLSPVQILFGRRTRTLMPTPDSLLMTGRENETRENLVKSKERQKFYYDRHTKEKPSLNKGQTVRVKLDTTQPTWEKGEIESVLPYRSYRVRTQDGSVYRRNRKHVQFSKEPPIIFSDSDVTEATPVPPPPLRLPPSVLPSLQVQQPIVFGDAKDIQPKSAKPDQVQTRSGRVVQKPIRYRE